MNIVQLPGAGASIFRIAPPLIIQRDEIDWAFEQIRKVIER